MEKMKKRRIFKISKIKDKRRMIKMTNGEKRLRSKSTMAKMKKRNDNQNYQWRK
jgi:hypothetical protein